MEITLPSNFEPRSYQLPFLKAWDNGAKRMVLVWHRRSGKDKTCIANLPKKMFDRVGAYYYFAPTYSQGKKIIWDGMDGDGFRMIDHIPKELRKGKPNETEMKVELVNGSFFQVIGTDKIDSVVGTNPVGCIFTEYSLQDPRAWDLVRPILAENGGWAVFIFTPRGMNHGWKILQQAKDNEEWFFQELSVDDTNAISEEVLLGEKKEMPNDLFQQEYYCKFIEGAGQVFRGVEKCVHHKDIELNPRHQYQIGVDLAKYQDFTVVTVIDLCSFHVVEVERFPHMDYTTQKAKIEATYLRYFKPKVIIDSTGVGDPIYEDLHHRGIRAVPFVFTEKSRNELLTNLQLLIEQGKLWIPDDQRLVDELQSMKYELIGKKGKVRMEVPSGLHDDMIMSLALACKDMPKNPLPPIGSTRFLIKQRGEAANQTSYV